MKPTFRQLAFTRRSKIVTQETAPRTNIGRKWPSRYGVREIKDFQDGEYLVSTDNSRSLEFVPADKIEEYVALETAQHESHARWVQEEADKTTFRRKFLTDTYPSKTIQGKAKAALESTLNFNGYTGVLFDKLESLAKEGYVVIPVQGGFAFVDKTLKGLGVKQIGKFGLDYARYLTK